MDRIPAHGAVVVFVTVLVALSEIADGLLPASAAESSGIRIELSNGSFRGDADGNCVVDAADLIFVRNLLGADAGSSGDALRADVNSDGKVDLLDLVFVRNRLGAICPDPAFGEMAYVPAGVFTASTGEEVHLDAYLIDIYEVSNAIYCLFLNSGGKDDYWRSTMANEIVRAAAPGGFTYSAVAGYEQRPVRNVSWNDAVAFCDWRSEVEGLPAGSYHLPYEAQWEKAAGWDPDLQKLWTYGYSGSDTIDSGRANYGNLVGDTTNVGSYHPWRSYYGLYDASGNVWEWCSDWYGSASYPSGATNPTGPETGTSRTLRGGSWSNIVINCRVASRLGNAPSNSSFIVGFRCARSL